MSLYQLEHLTRAYGRRIVLAIDRLEIEAGRMYALLGPNGAGKTTLLNTPVSLPTVVMGLFV